MPSKKVFFENDLGYKLSAKIDFPLSKGPHPMALFAHVFTGNKNLAASRHISRALTLSGVSVMRFDFTGLGESEGDFADSNFTSNVEDLIAAARFLESHYTAPSIIIGHSLGGMAALFAGNKLSSALAKVTLGAPSYPEHVTHLLADSRQNIKKTGSAKVNIAGRQFTIKKQFLEDLQSQNHESIIKNLNKALLVMHSPQDRIVEIENAARIYHLARHPKSFVTLDGADHLLADKGDAFYAGQVIASWAKRYVKFPQKRELQTHKEVVVRLDDTGFTTDIMAGEHGLVADEPVEVGGNDFGPSPYELLNASLGACTAMTLQMYARRKKWDLKEVRVHLAHERLASYADDSEHFDRKESRLDRFERVLELVGNLDNQQKNRLLEIANKCPVHRTLSQKSIFETSLLEAKD